MNQRTQVNRQHTELNQNSIVLVVDDEPIGLEVVKALLGSASYTIHCASSGPDALSKTESLRPDLILLDVLMPGMSGYDVCRAIRKTPHLSDIPIILLTALNDRDAKLRGLQVGADDFISKPFDRLELRARVNTILRLNRYKRINAERAKFGWVVESADDGYIILDKDDKITYANPQARHLFGLPKSDSLPADTFLTLAQHYFQCQPPQAWTNWPTPPPANGTRHLVRPQSSSVAALWLQVDLMENEEMAEDTRLIRLRNVTHEINQQRLRWSFHSQIQHKFRHPLSVLVGHLEILRGEGDITPEEQTMLIENSHRASQHLSRELLSVLDYVTMTAEGTPHNEYCTVAQLIDIAEHLEAQMPEVSLILRSAIQTPQTTKLPLSMRQLEAIMWELFQNAIKFHPQQTPSLLLSLRTEQGTFYLQITDNGVTLTPDQLHQIWTPYYQAERYYTGQVPGMGLGLSMIASTIWGLGGACQAYNRLGKAGLVVELQIPTTDDLELLPQKSETHTALSDG